MKRDHNAARGVGTNKGQIDGQSSKENFRVPRERKPKNVRELI